MYHEDIKQTGTNLRGGTEKKKWVCTTSCTHLHILDQPLVRLYNRTPTIIYLGYQRFFIADLFSSCVLFHEQAQGLISSNSRLNQQATPHISLCFFLVSAFDHFASHGSHHFTCFFAIHSRHNSSPLCCSRFFAICQWHLCLPIPISNWA